MPAPQARERIDRAASGRRRSRKRPDSRTEPCGHRSADHSSPRNPTQSASVKPLIIRGRTCVSSRSRHGHRRIGAPAARTAAPAYFFVRHPPAPVLLLPRLVWRVRATPRLSQTGESLRCHRSHTEPTAPTLSAHHDSNGTCAGPAHGHGRPGRRSRHRVRRRAQS